MQPHVESPFLRPVQMMVKPAGASCNLACAYCYYLDKGTGHSALQPRQSLQRMDDATLESLVKSYIAASPQEEVTFIWHGGEPLLRGLQFFARAMELQQRYADGHRISNTLQTNGTLLNDDWCRFFRKHDFLLGLSIDGLPEWHNRYRTDRAGRPTHDRVLRAAGLLNRHGVDWNAMAVVNNLNSRHPLEFYRFFRDTLDCRFIQFAPIVERIDPDSGSLLAPDATGGQLSAHSVSAEDWGYFLCSIFDEWLAHDVGDVFIQLFEATLANWAGVTPGVCTLARECGISPVIEHDGSVYTCDHFVYPSHSLGNIATSPLTEILNDGRLRAFGEAKRSSLPGMCHSCEYLHLCNGECPKNRIAVTPDGEPGLNHLCDGYRQFFGHSAPAMRYMLAEWRAGGPVLGPKLSGNAGRIDGAHLV